MIYVYTAALLTCLLFLILGLKKQTGSEFYLGTGRYGPLISGISIVAAFTGGGALFNTTSLASKYGWWAFFDVLPAVLGLLISAALVFVGFFGKRFSRTFFDVSSEIYDRSAVAIHYAQIACLYTLVIAAQLRAIAIVADYLRMDTWLAVFICCLTVALYSYRGFDTVTRTDKWQLALMTPMFIVFAYLAFDTPNFDKALFATTNQAMPTPLIAALCLPLLFLPISQEVHQRGAAVEADKGILCSYILAALIYVVLGTILVVAFTIAPNLSLGNLIAGENLFAGIVVTVGFLAAILSTLDTSTNIASHALQKLRPFGRLHSAAVQCALLAVGAVLFLYFDTVLSLILFALFLYMSGPGLTFVGIYAGIHPRACATIGASFSAVQSFFQFNGGRLLEESAPKDLLPILEPVQMGITLIALQLFVLVAVGLRRRFF